MTATPRAGEIASPGGGDGRGRDPGRTDRGDRVRLQRTSSNGGRGPVGEADLYARVLKRFLDCFMAATGLVLTAPMWLVLAIAIKLEDGGPVFYRQQRWGKDGAKFEALKFRSMIANGDAASSRVQATAGDLRVTRMGRMMRRAALDEMPQLINILRGDMSLVGPRALPVNERQRNDPEADLPDDRIEGFALRSHVRPGLTGIAQLYAPRDIARRHKFRYDAVYVRRQSVTLDLFLIFRSVWISLTGGWELYHRAVECRHRGGGRACR